MQLTKLGHACVRVEKDGHVLVIDPGTLTPEDDALEGAEAVLVTHEHADHLDAPRLLRALRDSPDLAVVTCAGASEALLAAAEEDGGADAVRERVTVLDHDQEAQAAGFTVTGVGSQHAVNHPDAPVVDNVGMLLDGRVLHLGDALTPTDAEVVLVAAQAPWMSVPEQAAYLQSIGAARILGVHDGLLNDAGLAVTDRWIEHEGERSGRDVRRLRVGEQVTL